MLQVLKIDCCCLKIFITYLHLELFYLGSPFPPLSSEESNVREERAMEKLEQDI